MAENELKKLNRTVDEAVKILKLYVGNSAQMNNMNEKQKEAVNKWFDVGEGIEQEQKKQRAFTERERDEKGRFFKKQEAVTLNFLNMAKAVGGIFVKMAKGIGSSLKNVTKGIVTHLSSFFSGLKQHFLGLFGEESEWFGLLGSIKDSLKGFFGWFVRGFIFLFRRTPAWAGKMVKTLGNMYSLPLKQMKMDFL